MMIVLKLLSQIREKKEEKIIKNETQKQKIAVIDPNEQLSVTNRRMTKAYIMGRISK